MDWEIRLAIAVSKSRTLKELRDTVLSIPLLNSREKAFIFNVCKKKLGRKLSNKDIHDITVAYHKAVEHNNSRARLHNLGVDMRSSRDSGRVFYLLSWHNKPATDHAPYQGKIYVDKYWKSVTNDNHKIRSYIRNHNTLTVQDIIKEPVYMLTRPYCRHRFIPLDNSEVLNNSLNKVKELHNEGRMLSKKGDYRARHLMHRYHIHKALGDMDSARADLFLYKKRMGN